MTLTLERLYHPDGHHLGTLWAGLSGSGKTTAVISTLQQAMKMKTFGPSHRFVIIDPKTQPNDYDLLIDPITDLGKAEESIRKERLTLYWPSLDFLEEEVSHLIDYIFQLSDSEEKSSYTLIIDEASILITPTRLPQSLKRLSVQGRAKRIKPVYISQRPLTNRWLDSNLSSLVLMRALPVDADNLSKRWGLDFSEVNEKLQEKKYSFMWFDLETAQLNMMNPVDLPKYQKRKKQGIGAKLRTLI